MSAHIPWSCDGDPDDCRRAWCARHHGELFLCAVCNQAEAELEPACPGPASAARRNALTKPGYTPYCGNERCPTMPRTRFTGEQFRCDSCGWESSYDPAFFKAAEEVRGS